MNDVTEGLQEFLEALGHPEEPIGMYYTDKEPAEGFAPNRGDLPSVEQEARNQIDWQAINRNWSCVIGKIWLARKKQTAAYFAADRFGCLGGAFFLGYLKPQLDFIVRYVSTGIPQVVEGERYLESPEMTRKFYEDIDPRQAPKPFCVFKPLSHFQGEEQPELVIFFARPEVVSGLHQLATFVTNDLEAVRSPFGSGCANILTWPLKYLEQGEFKAVLGGWDPSDRKFMKPDEITFTVPHDMYRRMIRRWPESFLTAPAWSNVKSKVEKSRKTWGES